MIERIRIITLVENMTDRAGLLAEHGLSFYIELQNKKILFDCGQSDAFVKNARHLGVEISEIDALILSHGHYDHTGGLKYFLQENNYASVYLKREAQWKKYNGERYIGMDANVPIDAERLHYIDQVTELCQGLLIVPEIKIYFPTDVHFGKMSVICDQDPVPDTFEDELFLSLIHNERIHIISSCSHRGISNIIKSAYNLFQLPVKTVVGGFHLKNEKADDAAAIAHYLNKMNIENIGVCHCTGIDRYVTLKNQCQGKVFYNCTGKEIIL